MSGSNKRPLEMSPEQLNANKKSNCDTMSVAEMSVPALENLLEKKLSDLPKKKDFDSMLQQIQSLQTQNELLSNEVLAVKEKNIILERKMNYMEKQYKSNHIIFSLPNNLKENATETINRCSNQILDRQDITFEDVTELPSRGNQTRLLVRTGNNKITSQIFKNSGRLKGSGVYINPDHTRDYQKKRQILLQVRHAIKKKHPSANPLVRGLKLQINNKTINCAHDGKLYCDNRDGMDVLREKRDIWRITF